MMQYKVAELEGALLDVAVAKAVGWREENGFWMQTLQVEGLSHAYMTDPIFSVDVWHPSSQWEHGGQIIEREGISLHREVDWRWQAGDLYCWMDHGDPIIQTHGESGPTPLIAAMRAYVASKYGETVEMP